MSFTFRQACLWIHRYTGLAMASFLLLAGITGSLLAFYDELDDIFNRKLAYSEVQDIAPLPIATLHDKIISRYPNYPFSSMPTSIEAGKSVVFTVDRVRNKQPNIQASNEKKPPFQEVYINAYTGDIVGTRDTEKWAWRNTMHKIFWLHRELLLGDLGKLILGIIALVWTLNCFIGFYLTLPRKVKTKNHTSHQSKELSTKKRASLMKRWQPAWKIRLNTNTFKLNYDLHQAFGLWLWLMLFVIAWSSVGFNLQQVYQPVMHTLVGLESKEGKPSKTSMSLDLTLKRSTDETMITVAKVNKANSIAYLSAQADIAAKENGVDVQQLLGIRWIADDKQWQMRFKTNKDIGKKGGASSITVDSATGKVTKINFGHQSTMSKKVDQWMATLHMGHISYDIGHVLYQIFLVLIGLAVSILSGTGVYLWYKGRQQRLKQSSKRLQLKKTKILSNKASKI